jgi:hypothetical protein
VAGAKGGQGTTTVATVLGALAAGHTDTVLATNRPEDVCAFTASRPGAGVVELAARLTLAGEPLGWGARPDASIVVADIGQLDDFAVEADLGGGPWTRWLVLRGPCYAALRAAVEARWPADGVILLTEPGRAITAVDVADVLGSPVIAQVPVEGSVARTLDAGLLLARLHHLNAFRALARLVQRRLVPTEQPCTRITPA